MPIKLPKGFQRRKSSGNALDEVNSGEPSFKVFARPASSGQSLDRTSMQSKPLPARRNSYETEDEDLFTVTRPDATNRGSGGTNTSLSTAPYDSGASSTRLSTSSTNPSSVDTKSDKNTHSQPPFENIPVPPPQQSRPAAFLRNAGRTFSFGMRSQKETAPEPELPPVPPLPSSKGRFSISTNRERSMTTSSISTATPPRLLESDFNLGPTATDEFANMFDNIGGRSPRNRSPQRPSPAPNSYTGNKLRPDRAAAPQPLNINKNIPIESSPWSYNSDTSRDGLMRSPSPSKTVTQNSPQTTVIITSQNSKPNFADQEENMFAGSPSRAGISTRSGRNNGPPPSSFHSNPASSLRIPTTLSPVENSEDTLFDPTLAASADLATKYQEKKPTQAAKKVMTPQQYERYKQQENERVRMNRVFGKQDSDDSGDDYEDDEEDQAERDKLAAKQRKKQEAHLAVYRQTMMKVTGESNGTSRSPTGQGTPDLSNRLSTINLDSKHSSRTSDGDEDDDEDVPLGILAAHGFPNKNRPPTRLASQGSNPNLRASMLLPNQPAPPASVSGESVRRGSLPAFARKLPEDPYYGAGLVNPANRESLSFHQSTPNLNAHSGASTNHPLHPSGLVGVIATEERTRAMRRGSPNAANGQYDLPSSMPQQHPGMIRSQTTGNMPNNMMFPGMMPGMPGMPPMSQMPQTLTPGDHAQLQMSQQMTQMMQMQMQWMQQMQQFMTGGQASPPVMAGPDPAAANNLLRPQSVPLQNYAGSTGRTMSTLSPNMAQWNTNTGSMAARPGSMYAASIAPSERSNIGLASRYRPVSTMPETLSEAPWQKRASTMTSTSFRPMSMIGAPKQSAMSTTVRKVPSAVDEDDDEAGWAEMKAKKEKKQRSWKLRKGKDPLQELYNGAAS